MADSTELLRRIARVGAQIDPDLSDRDVARLVAGGRRLARRRALRRGGAGLALVAAGALALLASRRGEHGADVAGVGRSVLPQPAAASPTAAVARDVRLADGSVATPLDDETRLTLRETSDRRVTIDLERGRGRFVVTPRPARAFVVNAGDVKVTVLGTIFRVERVADRIGVEVERGRVLVEWPSGSRTLAAGQGGWFPPLQSAARGQAAPARRAATGAPPNRTTASLSSPGVEPPGAPIAAVPAASSPRAETSDPSHAAVVLPPVSAPLSRAAPSSLPVAREPGVDTLLGEADAARVDGRPDDAVALLRQAVERHRSDRRAPLAAFTLGRVLLIDLLRPRDAAVAFAEARALAPQGTFAEDALAREVEALSKAGDRRAARARAEEYRRLYPNGRRASVVATFGGAE
jgi:transmembrane sensor